MAWNEPGGGNKDPWGGRGGDPGPPDLDEVVRKLRESFGDLFGGSKRTARRPRGSGPSGKLLSLGAVLLVLVWLASGIYIVEPAERGVVLRFGRYIDMVPPGPHWHIPYPVEDVILVNVDEISSFSHKASMLTKDENIVDVELTVQSRIQDAANYLFQDQSPEKTLRDATETVVRKTIGASELDFILTEGRSAIAAEIKEGVQHLMNAYKTGLEVTSVNMQPAKPPEQVKEAFDDAIKAREDKERLENKAEAYANEILPRARGEAARIEADAKAYRDQVIASAEGETARFLAMLEEYEKAPVVTRERLYLETMEKILGETPKILLDGKGGNSLLYLPVEQLLKGSHAGQGAGLAPKPQQSPVAQTRQPRNHAIRTVNRERRSR